MRLPPTESNDHHHVFERGETHLQTWSKHQAEIGVAEISYQRQASFLLWDGASCGDDLRLFYGKPTEQDVEGEAIARRLDITKATENGLKRLVDICDAATFGLNHKHVLDLSYRNAWKLDPVYFATKLNVLHAGLMDSIRYNLLPGDQGKKTFFAELHKLNVYGKGSFFKPHRNTPRGDKMFGSLVVVLPTAHEGGTLFLRDGGKECKFETDTVTPSSISYVAFFGDVEHEIGEVKSGYRVTLTYNLYFGESLDSQAIVSMPVSNSTTLFTTLPPNASFSRPALRATFRRHFSADGWSAWLWPFPRIRAG